MVRSGRSLAILVCVDGLVAMSRPSCIVSVPSAHVRRGRPRLGWSQESPGPGGQAYARLRVVRGGAAGGARDVEPRGGAGATASGTGIKPRTSSDSTPPFAGPYAPSAPGPPCPTEATLSAGMLLVGCAITSAGGMDLRVAAPAVAAELAGAERRRCRAGFRPPGTMRNCCAIKCHFPWVAANPGPSAQQVNTSKGAGSVTMLSGCYRVPRSPEIYILLQHALYGREMRMWEMHSGAHPQRNRAL